MQEIKYNKHNYYRSTYAVYTEVDSKELPFDKWHYSSKSGSAYFYTTNGVYRKSNHWGRAAKCRWVLMSGATIYVSKGRERIGYANWTDFYENNETTKAYFVKVDYSNKTVTYDHKSRDTSGIAIYRTAKQTQKIIQKVKKILLFDNWSKYYDFDDIEQLREELIEELITDN